jgi:hypothetical protein
MFINASFSFLAPAQTLLIFFVIWHWKVRMGLGRMLQHRSHYGSGPDRSCSTRIGAASPCITHTTQTGTRSSRRLPGDDSKDAACRGRSPPLSASPVPSRRSDCLHHGYYVEGRQHPLPATSPLQNPLPTAKQLPASVPTCVCFKTAFQPLRVFFCWTHVTTLSPGFPAARLAEEFFFDHRILFFATSHGLFPIFFSAK